MIGFAVSDDGVAWSRLGNRAVFFPPTGDVRDPTITYRNGWYLLAYTWSDWPLGSPQRTDLYRRLQVARSRDLINWEIAVTIDTDLTVSGTRFAWAPQWYEEGTDAWLLASLSSDNDATGMANPPFVPYAFKLTADDASTFALGQKMVRTGNRAGSGAWDAESQIDASVVKIGATYHLIAKEERTMHLVHFTAPALLGPWTFVRDLTSAFGWGEEREAPCLVRLDNGKWRVYVDHYAAGFARPNYAESTNADDLTAWGGMQLLPTLGNGRHIDYKRLTLEAKPRTDLDLVIVNATEMDSTWRPLLNMGAVFGGSQNDMTLPAPPTGYAPHGMRRVGDVVYVRFALPIAQAIAANAVFSMFGLSNGLRPGYNMPKDALLWDAAPNPDTYTRVPILLASTGGVFLIGPSPAMSVGQVLLGDFSFVAPGVRQA